MGDNDMEEQDAFRVPRDEEGGFPENPKRRVRRVEKFHKNVSRWMLPKELRETYLERANCCPPPIFIILVSLAELGVFIYYAVWKPQKQWVTLGDGIWRSPLTYKPEQREEAWRFISYMFVHAGVEHIMGNMLMQLFLGIPLELVHKGFEVGMVYMAGVLAGSLASSIFDPYSALVGASGGVYALIGGYFMNAVVNFREMIPVLGVFRILVIVLIVGTDVGFAIYRRFITHEAGLKGRCPAEFSSNPNLTHLNQLIKLLLGILKTSRQVSFVAHIAGGVAGMTIGYVFFTSYDKALLKDPRFWLCIVGYIAFFFFAVIFNIFLSPAPA
ncbi:Rhomboid-related protein 2 [Labeo rohita]|uniref:rhomboid protease n=1 Tax=Labeo rohita TaxID=84645 RepID=A0ABQ8LYN3_LABRO|nr:Rhomboid-related protein 2 [Labeo rohita]